MKTRLVILFCLLFFINKAAQCLTFIRPYPEKQAKNRLRDTVFLPYMTMDELRSGKADSASLVQITDKGKTGIFKYDHTDVTSIDDSSMVILAGIKRYKRQYNGYINLKWFGAKGDGTTDDTYSIRKCIAYLAKGGGGTAFCPAGNYVSQTLTISKGIAFIGENKEKTVFTLKSGFNGDLFRLFNCARGGISNMTLFGNSFNNAVGNGVLIAADTSASQKTASMVKDLFISNFKKSGIRAEAVSWIFTVQNNYIQYCDEYGIYNSTTDNAFYDNEISNCGLDGFYLYGAANTRIKGGKIISNGKSGLDTNAAGLHLESSPRCIISTVETQDNYYHGFYISNSDDVQLINVLADGNNRHPIDTTLKHDPPGFGYKLYRVKNSIFVGEATNYRISSPSQTASSYIKDSQNIDFQVRKSNQLSPDVEITSSNIKYPDPNLNPTNLTASANFSWFNDTYRLRIGGSGAGATSGFDFQGVGNVSFFKLNQSTRSFQTGTGILDNVTTSSNANDAIIVKGATDNTLKAISQGAEKFVNNPGNANASVKLGWSGNQPVLKIQGTGLGVDNGVSIQTTTGTKLLNVDGQSKITVSQYQLSALNTAPASSTDTGTLGEVRITANYIYVCVATNTWVRAALASW
jgi:parallel beta-helix repeat protein